MGKLDGQVAVVSGAARGQFGRSSQVNTLPLTWQV
jgi:predicted methyltransferase MtxX (methanogen marker protein 4)